MLENSTPYSGPPGAKRTPGGKWSWMMNAAVRVVNEPKSLLKYEAVAALASATARLPWLPFMWNTPSALPSTSTTATVSGRRRCRRRA